MPALAERTWELELLISGALVFALVRLPAAADLLYDRAAPHLAGVGWTLAFGLHYAAKLLLYGLIAAFIIHLAARAYWGGLVGLRTVFPDGIRWENSRYGPIFRGVYQRGHPPVEAQIARTDRFCSAIFAFAFSMVFMLAVVSLLVGIFSAVAYAVSRLLLDGRYFIPMYFSSLGLFFVAPVLTWVDRRYGDELLRMGWPGRAIGALARVSYYGMLGPVYMPVIDTLATNVGRKTIFAITQVFMLGLLATFLVSEFTRMGALTADSYAYFPEDGSPRVVDPGYYEELRVDGGMYSRSPSIQAEVIRGPYVRLFLPYNPRRHNAVVGERCPGVEPLARGGLRMRLPAGGPVDAVHEESVLACLASLQPVTLNGSPVADLRFHFYEQPGTGIRGIRAMIPTAGLPEGENLLTVAVVPRAADADGKSEPKDPRRPYHIPFWMVR